MPALLNLFLVLCFVVITACSETVSNDETTDDVNLRFAPLNDGVPVQEDIQRRYWAMSTLPSEDRTGFFVFNDILWLRSSHQIERLFVRFDVKGRWNAWLLMREFDSDELRVENFVAGDYLFTEDGQFMMSGGRFGCFSSVVGRYYLRGDALALRANGDTFYFKRYISVRDLLSPDLPLQNTAN